MPDLVTPRLRLRPFRLDDAPVVAELCGAWEIADTTANMPHSYELSMAEEWIASHPEALAEGTGITFAITQREPGHLAGAIGIHIDRTNRSGELGYWVGKHYWNRGYATEATRAVIAYGFEELELNRIHARHMTRNLASGRVMQKADMTFEGILRQSLYRWDKFEDVAIYSILRIEYERAQAD